MKQPIVKKTKLEEKIALDNLMAENLKLKTAMDSVLNKKSENDSELFNENHECMTNAITLEERINDIEIAICEFVDILLDAE